MEQVLLSFNNYAPWGDAAVIAVSLIMVILLSTSYVRHTKSYHIFMYIIGELIAAALVNIVYHVLIIQNDPGSYAFIYGFRILYHALLFNIFHLFVLYTATGSTMEHKKARTAAIISTVLFTVVIGADIILTLTGKSFRITPDGVLVDNTNHLMIGYILYLILLLVLMRSATGLLFKRVMSGFYWTMAIAVIIRFAQLPFGQTSLTTLSFTLPAIAMLYIMHSNPYNVILGTVDIRAMEDMVRTLYARKIPFIYMSLLLTEFNEEGKELPADIRALTRSFSVDYFKNCVLFQIGNGHIILMASKRLNPDYEDSIQNMLQEFQKQYRRLQHPYKILIGESVDDISRKNEYASLIASIQEHVPENTVYRVGPDDITKFNRNEYILEELHDIYRKKDLDDPRVLAFCQPVYNLRTRRFDTSEALMRLKLEKTGMVFPDQFIPLAEKHNYIHVLTEIILHKTCKEIRRLLDEGYQITRISVNVSSLELKDEGFCNDITRIINGSSIPGEKIAIELTESQSETDFMIMKRKIDELRGQGIRFYLDDFGTGYSNMERIMELPFDIIKFDRSLVIESGRDERSERIVENLAHVFRDMDYSLLYEGVENNLDEERCREMSASYLQGFKYSRPIPIEHLKEFLTQAG